MRIYDKNKKQIGVQDKEGKIFYFDPDYLKKKEAAKKPTKKKGEDAG